MKSRLDPLEVASAATAILRRRPRPLSVLRELAERFAVTSRTISRILHDEGVSIVPPKTGAPPASVLHRLYNIDGLTAAAIGANHNVTTRTAERWLAQRDVRKT